MTDPRWYFEAMLSGDNVRTLDDVTVPKETVHRPVLEMAIDERGQVAAQRPQEDGGTICPSDASIWGDRT
jgi:hypothetical protein